MYVPFSLDNKSEKYLYYPLPQMLFSDSKLRVLSSDAKILYSFLINRCRLSLKNEWYDSNGDFFVYYKQEEACEKLNIGVSKAVRIFNELEQIGLIKRKKQGQGKPTKIYIFDFAQEISDGKSQTFYPISEKTVKTFQNDKSEKEAVSSDTDSEVLTSQNDKSCVLKMTSPYNNRLRNNEIRNNNQSIYQELAEKQLSEIDGWTDEEQDEFEADVKEQIEYDILITQGIEQSTLDLIVDIIVEAYNPQANPLKINGQLVSPTSVIRQYGKLNSEHIKYILNCISEVSAKKRIKDLRGYLRTSLYNAPHTMELHTSNEVNFILGSK